MAACGSLQHIFEKSLPENPTLLESLSSPWNQLKTNPTTLENQYQQSSSFTEIFGELHFKESSLYPTSTDTIHGDKVKNYDNNNKNAFTKNCTEGLGFESSDHITNNNNNNWLISRVEEDDDGERERKNNIVSDQKKRSDCGESVRRSRATGSGGKGGFPPPISCLSKSGKPRFCLKSYREEGRFVLKEIRVRSEEFLHACREDGRLKLHFVHPNYDEGIPEEDEDEEQLDQCIEEEDDDNDDNNGCVHQNY